jgi:hypothetical protein
MNVKIEGSTLHIMLDLQEPTPSVTGKTEVVAGTGGRWRSGLKIEGKALWLIATAYVYPDKKTDQAKKAVKKGRRKTSFEEDDEE